MLCVGTFHELTQAWAVLSKKRCWGNPEHQTGTEGDPPIKNTKNGRTKHKKNKKNKCIHISACKQKVIPRKRAAKSEQTWCRGDLLDNESLGAGLQPTTEIVEPLNTFFSLRARLEKLLCLPRVAAYKTAVYRSYRWEKQLHTKTSEPTAYITWWSGIGPNWHVAWEPPAEKQT